MTEKRMKPQTAKMPDKPMNKRHVFNILGRSNATLSMILDTLHVLYGSDVKVQIIENMNINVDLPFSVEGIIVDNIYYDHWKKEKGICKRNCILGVYKPVVKRIVYNFFLEQMGINRNDYFNLIFPNAVISDTAKPGRALHIGPQCVIAPYTELSDFITINRNVSIGHHTVIGEFCTINPGVNIAGRCSIGEGGTVGMGSNILDGISIGKNSVIGAGSLVTRDILENAMAYGVPAKSVKELS